MAVFQTILTADLSVSDELVSVASNDGARTTYEWRAVIDDEVVYVFSGVAEGLVWGIHRGKDDTDPADHLTGAVLTATRVGQYTVDDVLVEDDVSPTAALTDEAGTDLLRSDPEVAGV